MLLLSTCTGLSPSMAWISIQFQFLQKHHWPGPRSLATTSGVSVDVLSSGYLDVSVLRVRFLPLCIQDKIPFNNWKPETTRTMLAHSPIGSEFQSLKVGFPIRKSTDQSLLAAPRGLSQRTTSFIACVRQGIHRTPLRHLISPISNAHSFSWLRRNMRTKREAPLTGLFKTSDHHDLFLKATINSFAKANLPPATYRTNHLHDF